MQSLGQYLKSEREKRGIRLEEIASSTKIHIQNLYLMEEDRWKELPQEPFIRGFISAYARYVGLDQKEILKLFSQYQASPERIADENLEASSSHTPNLESREEEISRPENRFSHKLKKVNLSSQNQVRTGLLVALFVLVLIVVIAKKGNEETQTAPVASEVAQPNLAADIKDTSVSTLPQTPPSADLNNSAIVAASDAQTTTTTLVQPVSVEKKSETAPTVPPPVPTPAALQAVPPAPSAQASAPIAANPTEPSPAPAPKVSVVPPKLEALKIETTPISGHELNVQVKYKSWMKIVIDNEPPKESYLEEGAKTNFQAKEKIKLVLGNSSGSVVTHNGEAVKGTKYSGTIRYYIFPKGSRFPQDKPKAKDNEESSSNDQEPIATTPEENSDN